MRTQIPLRPGSVAASFSRAAACASRDQWVFRPIWEPGETRRGLFSGPEGASSFVKIPPTNRGHCRKHCSELWPQAGACLGSVGPPPQQFPNPNPRLRTSRDAGSARVARVTSAGERDNLRSGKSDSLRSLRCTAYVECSYARPACLHQGRWLLQELIKPSNGGQFSWSCF